ncbi:BnaC07g07170D [Brassica napus]|uniref:BnaC07g07170D protein n=1 Tax=Brassica napus TaxID=3708 RepID=A0A078HQE1_BRANA|nr:BnaC07g07170D [Brassica napus]
MIEAVPALTKAVHEAGSSGSEGDFAGDDELSEEERKGKRSISPGHARDTDCSGKAGVVSIISVGNEAVNGDSQFGWSDDEEDVDVVRMREETRSEAEIRKTTKQKSNQSSSDVVDADSIASCVKGRLSGDLSRVSEELNRVSAEVSRMATELKSFGAAFKSFQTAIVSKVDDMLKTFHGQTVQNITNPMIHSPAPAMQHVPPPVAVRRTGEDQSKYSHVGVNDVVNQPTASSHGGLDASKIIENALRFAEKECFPLSNVETVGVNPTMHTIGNARVNGSEPSPNFSSAEEEPILDPGLVFPKPTFSLGLSQEEPNNESSGCDVVNEESLVIALNKDNGVTVAEGDAPSERHSENPVVVNVLIHHTRSVYNSASDQITANQAVFFDTKFVAAASTRVAGYTSLLTWIRHIGFVCALTPQVGSSMFWTATSLSAVM